MGKDWERKSKRRRFDDDRSEPDEGQRLQFRGPARSNPVPLGASQEATVKWFNAEKGFGFVTLADGSGDVFLHIAVLEAAGHEAVEPDTKLQVQVGIGQKGRQVTAILGVDASGATPRPTRRSPAAMASTRDRPDASSATALEGTVKWFNGEKGFGFVAADTGGKDVFVHIKVLERAGVRELAEGQRVSMRVVTTAKGREAISLELVG